MDLELLHEPYTKEYHKVYEAKNGDYILAKKLLSKSAEEFIKYMRGTYSHFSSMGPIGDDCLPPGHKIECKYKGYEYIIIVTDFKMIAVYEVIYSKLVAPSV